MRGVEARIVRQRSSLALQYAIEGRIEELRVPVPRPPRIGRELWKHTCCEVFVGRSGSPAYLEFNFSPSGEWAGHAFERYRTSYLERLRNSGTSPGSVMGLKMPEILHAGDKRWASAKPAAPSCITRPFLKRTKSSAE